MVSIKSTRERPEVGAKYRVFVYHHTHWDREWWAPLQVLRARLVDLIDDLLDVLDSDHEFRCFLLDGQTIILKDYLEIRPENREKLVRYINDYRIQCGPWYILPDEFLVSGEAHIRNLWLGQRLANQLGFRNLDVGYIPDTFGHISQMPQILRGFGIDNAMLWRGTGGDESFKQEFTWEAADGSTVLAHWFALGYFEMPFIHFDNPLRPYEDKLGRVRRLVQKLASHASTNCLLLPYGGDHKPIDRRLPRLLRTANQAEELEDYEFHWSTTQEYLEAIRARASDLPVRRGELRESGAQHPHLLPGVLSTRMYLKQLNFNGQIWLERYAEPLAALAWRRGRRYDANMLWTAWEFLIQNHPHDSICGCSVDQVHREMIARFDQSRQIAEIVAEQSVDYINAQIDTTDMQDDDLALVVHNAQGWERTGGVGVLVDRAFCVSPRTHMLADHEGREIPFQVKSVDTPKLLTGHWRHTEVRFVATDVPALGYATYRLHKRDAARDVKQIALNTLHPSAVLKGSSPLTDLRVGDGVVENRWLRVEADRRHGALRVTDKRSGQVYEGLNVFEDGGDAGDTYNYAAPLSDMVLRSDEGTRAHISVADAGYASVTLRIDLDWALPAALTDDRMSRQVEYITTRISTFVTLTADSPRVEIATEWDNRTHDHRLRVLFPLGAPITASHAEGHFDVVTRSMGIADRGNGWPEPLVMTQPQQGYVSVSNGARGLTIANRGLPEFEALPDGTVCLTLLRAVGWLSRDDLLTRAGGAGPDTPTPDAQCTGRQRVEYAIVPHEGSWLDSGAYLVAHDYLAPLYGSVTGKHNGGKPRRDGLLEIEGDHTLLLSACKKAERSNALILRVWNVAPQSTRARVRLQQRPTSVRMVDLKEDPLGKGELLLADDGSFELQAGPRQIVTVEIRY
jgi:mannosylglycerate hydrolase